MLRKYMVLIVSIFEQLPQRYRSAFGDQRYCGCKSMNNWNKQTVFSGSLLCPSFHNQSFFCSQCFHINY